MEFDTYQTTRKESPDNLSVHAPMLEKLYGMTINKHEYADRKKIVVFRPCR